MITYIPLPEGAPFPELKYGQIIFRLKGTYMGRGGTGFLERLPSGHVLKTPVPNPWRAPLEQNRFRNMRLEAKVYARIGVHPRVPSIINWDENTACLTMEWLPNGDLKEYVQSKGQDISRRRRLLWSCQAAEAVGVLHNHQVIHCDLSPRNFLLDAELNLKISDFGGASLCGSDPSAVPATRFCHPGFDFNVCPVYADDVFSLGSLIYFIMTGFYPYHDLPSDEVERLYERHEFPDTSLIICGDIIAQCWDRQIPSAHAVHEALALVEDE